MDAAKRIVELRKKANLNTTELAKLVGISQSGMSKIEHGTRGIDLKLLEKICIALNISLKDFFDIENDAVTKGNIASENNETMKNIALKKNESSGEDFIIRVYPDRMEFITTGSKIPIEKIQLLNKIASEFKDTYYKTENHSVDIKQSNDAIDISGEDLLKLAEHFKIKE